MIDKLTHAYIYLLAGFVAILIIDLLALHISYLLGSGIELGGRVIMAFFAINLPVLGLANDRNIWKNELQQCPSWIRTAHKILFAYAILVVVLCILGNMHVPSNFFLAYTALMLMFACSSACVLYATFTTRANISGFRKRIQRSLVATAAFSAWFAFIFLLPNSHHHR